MKICRTCNISKPDTDFREYTNRNKFYIKNECRECERARARIYKDKYKDQAKYYKVKDRYGLSKEEYDTLLNNYKNCAICNILFENTTPHIDHDHTTNEVRGLLCPNCNKGLGLFKDNPAILLNATKYLLSFKIEGSTTIPKGSTCKCMEVPSPSIEGEDIVCSCR